MSMRNFLDLNNISYIEKETWMELTINLSLFVYYLYGLSQLQGFFATHASAVGTLVIKIVILSIVLAIILGILFGIVRNQNEYEKDERDELIQMKGIRMAYYTLLTGVTIIIIHTILKGSVGNTDFFISSYPFFASVPLVDFCIHGLLIFSFLTHIVQNSVQLVLYRKGF